MVTCGNNSISSNNYWNAYGLNYNNQIAAKIVMPQDGTINILSAYFGGDGVTLPNCYLCLWDSGGNILRQSGRFSQGSGSRSSQGQDWAHQTVTDYAAGSGQTLYIGWSRDPTVWCVFGMNSSGTYYAHTNTSTNSFSGFSSYGGNIGAYVDYYIPGSGTGGDPNPPVVTGGIKTWNGSQWTKHPVKVWNGSQWVKRPVRTWSGSSWIRRV